MLGNNVIEQRNRAGMQSQRIDPERLGDFGVNNPAILADSLYRMKGTKQGNA